MAKFIEEDGIVWATVRLTMPPEIVDSVGVSEYTLTVMADNEEDALYFAIILLRETEGIDLDEFTDDEWDYEVEDVEIDKKFVTLHEVTIAYEDEEPYNVLIAECGLLPIYGYDESIFYWVAEAPYVGMEVGDAKVVAV
jgi:hypothetical protein